MPREKLARCALRTTRRGRITLFRKSADGVSDATIKRPDLLGENHRPNGSEPKILFVPAQDFAMKALPPASSPTSYFALGEIAPFFELVDPIVGILRSPDLLQVGPVLLTFYRDAWCGCCSADLRDVTQSAPLLRSRNVSVLGVFHDLSKEANIRIRETYNLEFPLVDDPNGRAAQAFGIRRSAREMAEIENSFGPELLALKEGQPWIIY
jgi:peroxiredoxin